MHYDTTDYLFLGTIGSIIIAFIVVLYLAITSSIKEQKAWNKFSVEQNCIKIGEMKADVSVGSGVTTSGNAGIITVVNPSKTAYKCDDGVTYWR